MDQLLFCFCIIISLSSIITIISFNPIHSVIWLVITFLTSAGLLLTLRFEFLALLIIIIYVGAITILFLFVIMMLDILQLKRSESINHIFSLIMILGIIALLEV